jgi:uncharacterized protein (TIGR02646 family)
VKFIEKNQEPVSFTIWKKQANNEWKPTWDTFQSPEKPELHDALLAEQGNICCYCNDRIGKPSPKSHIEHIKPRSQFEADRLNYRNLVASCQGEDEQRLPIHCGQAKADWPDMTAFNAGLMISPLDEHCEDAFRFTAIGEIRPADGLLNAAARETIKRLHLDVKKLEASRRQAIEGVLEGIEAETVDSLQKQIASYSQKNEDGNFLRFCSAIIYILKQHLELFQASLI